MLCILAVTQHLDVWLVNCLLMMGIVFFDRDSSSAGEIAAAVESTERAEDALRTP